MAFDYKKYNDWGREYLRLKLNNALHLDHLKGEGTKMLVVENDGNVSSQDIPTGGGGEEPDTIGISFEEYYPQP